MRACLLRQLPNYPYVPFLPETRIKGFGLLARQLSAYSKTSPVSSTLATSSSPTVSQEDETAHSTAVGLTEAVVDAFESATAPVLPSPGPTAEPVSVLEEAEAVLSSASSAAVTATEDIFAPKATSVPAEFLVLLGGELDCVACRDPTS